MFSPSAFALSTDAPHVLLHAIQLLSPRIEIISVISRFHREYVINAERFDPSGLTLISNQILATALNAAENLYRQNKKIVRFICPSAQVGDDHLSFSMHGFKQFAKDLAVQGLRDVMMLKGKKLWVRRCLI